MVLAPSSPPPSSPSYQPLKARLRANALASASVLTERRSTLRSLSFPDFLSHVQVEDQNRGYIAFELWPHLITLAALLIAHHNLAILKARRLGISWILAAYALYIAMRQEGSFVLIISKGLEEANEVVRHATFIYDHLPSRLQAPCIKRNTKELEFAGGGRIRALPSTRHAGRSLGATVVIVDEAAFHPWATSNYQAYRATTDGGGQLIMVSTSAGPSGLFFSVYNRAKERINSLTPLFLGWWLREERSLRDPETNKPILDANGYYQPDMSWHQRERAEYEGTAAEFAQEYPANEREAWAAGTGLVFGMDVDGVLIYDPDDFEPSDIARTWDGSPPRGGNLSPDPCDFADCVYHFAGVDWGGGDPTAVGVYGQTSSGRVHKFGEFHRVGATGTDTISAFLELYDPQHELFDRILCGKDQGTSIEDLKNLGWPAIAADTDRKQGLSTMARFLKQRRMTYNPTLQFSLQEFDSYYWAEHRDPRTGEKYATNTPENHHGDHCDENRYVLMEVERLERARGPLPSWGYEGG